jgi:hypothetical protein
MIMIGGPMTTSLRVRKISISSPLQSKIRKLSSDCKFKKFVDDDYQEDLVMMKRKEAEDLFQRAMCRRIWWSLSSKERTQIRSALFKTDPYYKNSIYSDVVESVCVSEIQELLLKRFK